MNKKFSNITLNGLKSCIYYDSNVCSYIKDLSVTKTWTGNSNVGFVSSYSCPLGSVLEISIK